MITRQDDRKLEELIADHVIEDWRGLEDAKGNAIPCTSENKIFVLDHFNEIASWVTDMATTMGEELMKEKEETEKNSQDTSDL